LKDGCNDEKNFKKTAHDNKILKAIKKTEIKCIN